MGRYFLGNLFSASSLDLLVLLLIATSVAIGNAQRVPTPLYRLSIPGALGPESLAFDRFGGGPYTGVSDGRIIRWDATKNRSVNFAVTTPSRLGCEGPHDHVQTEARCGRPLGLSFNQRTGQLYIADAYKGLLVVGPNGEVTTPVATQAQGVPFRFTNDVVIEQKTGIAYFTDTSTRFQRNNFQAIISTGDSTGRLLRYDPRTNAVTVLLGGLRFPNGVPLGRNGDFLLVTETTTGRVLKYWLGSGRTQVAALLPGNPDNIRRNRNGEFWVAMNQEGPLALPVWEWLLGWIEMAGLCGSDTR